jgi:hypothetical protein
VSDAADGRTGIGDGSGVRRTWRARRETGRDDAACGFEDTAGEAEEDLGVTAEPEDAGADGGGRPVGECGSERHREPVAGKVAYLKHNPGQFLNALKLESAALNENVVIGFEPTDPAGGRVAIKLITGLGTTLQGEMLSMNLATMQFRKVRLPRRDDCAVCG